MTNEELKRIIKERKNKMNEKIELLMDIVVELDARNCSNNCINEKLQKYGWMQLCEYAIKLLNEIK